MCNVRKPSPNRPDMMDCLQHVKHVWTATALRLCQQQSDGGVQTEVVHVCKMAAHHNKGQEAVQALTRMEPPSVKSKLMTDDEKICSSGLYVTNWACDSLHSHNRARVAIWGIKSHAAHCLNVLARLRRGVADARLNLACAARPTCCSRLARFCVVRCLVKLYMLLYSCCFASIAHRTNQSDSSKIVPGVTVIIQPLLHILIKALDIIR